jgi:hypothetical protein
MGITGVNDPGYFPFLSFLGIVQVLEELFEQILLHARRSARVTALTRVIWRLLTLGRRASLSRSPPRRFRAGARPAGRPRT